MGQKIWISECVLFFLTQTLFDNFFNSFKIIVVRQDSSYTFSYKKSMIFFAEEPSLLGRNVQDVDVSGIIYPGFSSKFKLTLPVDLCQSVEEVRLINDDPNLSNFESNVLSLVENEKKVLIIHSFCFIRNA